ncbi:MAG: hypothetical protein ACRD59_19150 [Candidatus Acidiferrales bacterium]
MDNRKRNFLGTLVAVAVAAPIAAVARTAFGQQGVGRRGVPPPGGINPPDAEPPPPAFDPKRIQQHNQKVILDDVQKLYKLAGELKDQVEKTDSTSTLSLSMVQKAKEVEKLAKQIANLAVGS